MKKDLRNLTEVEEKEYQALQKELIENMTSLETLPDSWEDNYEEEFEKLKKKGDVIVEKLRKYIDI